MVHKRLFLKIYSLKFCDIWQNVYFYRILDNENFKLEVEQTSFMTHLLITTWAPDYNNIILLII